MNLSALGVLPARHGRESCSASSPSMVTRGDDQLLPAAVPELQGLLGRVLT
jgi:hypothetical protein